LLQKPIKVPGITLLKFFAYIIDMLYKTLVFVKYHKVVYMKTLFIKMPQK